MQLGEISALVSGGESETLEFKRTTGARRKAMQSVCAMFNTRGGTVLFGITPKGDVVGQQVSERTVEELSQEVRQIEPRVAATIARIGVTGDHEVLMICVGRGSARPYRYRGDAFLRIRFRHNRAVPSTHIATVDLTKQQQAILMSLTQTIAPLALREIRSELGPETDERRLRSDLLKLKALQLVTRFRRGLSTRWKRL